MDMYLHENNIDIGNIVAEVYVLDALITVKTETVLYIICIY